MESGVTIDIAQGLHASRLSRPSTRCPLSITRCHPNLLQLSTSRIKTLNRTHRLLPMQLSLIVGDIEFTCGPS